MNAPDEQPWGDLTLEALEERLRGLPQPPVPAELESKLLAAIPGALGAGRKRGRGARPLVWAALGLAAALVVAVPLLRPGLRGAQQTLLPGALESVSPRFILVEFVGQATKETEPCYILPQRSKSRS
jgi:hypothetical protein